MSSIKDAVKIFYEKNISSLMVLENNLVIGIITEKDLISSTLVFNHKENTPVKKS